jgi:hypothetical protein
LFLDVGCIVFGSENKAHSWRENYTIFEQNHLWLIDMGKKEEFA